MKNIRYLIEAFFAYILFYFFKCLPPAWASNIGGFIGRTIGPNLATSRKAYKHLSLALPTHTGQHGKIVNGLWDNMGRVIAEYPHLKKIARYNTEICGDEIIQKLLKQGNGAIFIGCHQGNWEINIPTLFLKYGAKADLTYRAPNNPYIENLLARARNMKGLLDAHPKSRQSGRKIMNTVKNKGYLGILIDQKYNEGIEIPFFGEDAMTNQIAFQLAQKYNVPLIPVQNERLEGCKFRLTVHPQIELFNDKNEPLPLEKIMHDVHIMMENWIKARPEQWIWMHKRWKNS